MQPILDYLRATDQILLSAFAFFVGLIAGHRIALIRDKRKEFNDIAIPLRAIMLNIRDNPTPFTKWPGAAEIDLIQHYMGPWQRWRFSAAIERHKGCHHEQMVQDPKSGDVGYRDAAPIVASAKEILKHLRLQ